MAAAMQHALSLPGLRQLLLSVTAGNAAAIATYEAFGFQVCGTVPEALQVDGHFYDEVQMVCHLGALRSVAAGG
jgi:RimJ/RimL family protein N-acetyltransferase